MMGHGVLVYGNKDTKAMSSKCTLPYALL
jgi:hypothetical protein